MPLQEHKRHVQQEIKLRDQHLVLALFLRSTTLLFLRCIWLLACDTACPLTHCFHHYDAVHIHRRSETTSWRVCRIACKPRMMQMHFTIASRRCSTAWKRPCPHSQPSSVPMQCDFGSLQLRFNNYIANLAHSANFRGGSRIRDWGGHMASTECEPITGVWGLCPQQGPGAEPLVRDKAPWCWTLFCFVTYLK